MAKTASAFFGGQAISEGRVISYLNHGGKSGAGYSMVPKARDADGKIVTGDTRHIPYGSQVIMDFGSMHWGAGCFRPYDMSRLVPYGAPMPVVEAGTAGEFVDLLRVDLLVGAELVEWTVTGVLGQNALWAVWTQYSRSEAAATGQIPVVQLNESEAIAIASRQGEISYKPALAIVGWVDRDPAVFGERCVALPQARLAAAPKAPAVAAPVFPPVQPIRPVMPVRPQPVVLPTMDNPTGDVDNSDPYAATDPLPKPGSTAQDGRQTITSTTAKPQF
jgi:hypothetical protein